MTRDEAIEILTDTVFPGAQLEGDNRRKSAALVDAWSKLGMLKLDRPRSVDERLKEMSREGLSIPACHIRQALDDVGLKIVEK